MTEYNELELVLPTFHCGIQAPEAAAYLKTKPAFDFPWEWHSLGMFCLQNCFYIGGDRILVSTAPDAGVKEFKGDTYLWILSSPNYKSPHTSTGEVELTYVDSDGSHWQRQLLPRFHGESKSIWMSDLPVKLRKPLQFVAHHTNLFVKYLNNNYPSIYNNMWKELAFDKQLSTWELPHVNQREH